MENEINYDNYDFLVYFFNPGYDIRIGNRIYFNEEDIYIFSKRDKNLYLASLFTYDFIFSNIMEEKYFWASDFIIIQDLKRETIYEVINKLFSESDIIQSSFRLIGTHYEIFKTNDIMNEYL